MVSWLQVLKLSLVVATIGCLFACKEGPRGRQGLEGVPGLPGASGESPTLTDAEETKDPTKRKGKTSGGGGGFVQKNSKKLFRDTLDRLVAILEAASPENFEAFGDNWTKPQVLRVIKNFEMANTEIVTRNESDELFFDYGYDKNGTPWLKALKPFFDYYSTVPIKGPKSAYYYNVQTQITLEFLHELSHLVLNHPKGDVTKDDIARIEEEAAQFSEQVFVSLVSEALLCEGDFRFDLLDIDEPDELETAKDDKLFWYFIKHGDRGIVLKKSDLISQPDWLTKLQNQPIELDSLSFFSEKDGIIGKNSQNLSFPPAPIFDDYFHLLLDKEITWGTVIYALSTHENSTKIVMDRYRKGFSAAAPVQGGISLVKKIEDMEETIWGSEIGVDFRQSRHEINIENNDDVGIYTFENRERNIRADPRQDEQFELIGTDEFPVRCEPIIKPMALPEAWADRLPLTS